MKKSCTAGGLEFEINLGNISKPHLYKIIKLQEKIKIGLTWWLRLGVVAHACNPSTLPGQGRQII